MVGLKNVAVEKYSQVISLIDETLERIIQDGFNAEKIEASLNSTEFHLRELNTGSRPRGLTIMTEMLKNWIYDRDPLQEVRFEEELQILRDHLQEDPNYLAKRLQEYLLENKHRVTLTLSPKPGLNTTKQTQAEEALRARKEALSTTQVEHLVRQTRELVDHQSRGDTPEQKAKIPRLTKADLAGEVERVDTQVHRQGEREILVHTLPTNGISYVDFAFDLRHLSAEEYLYLPFLQRAYQEFDTQENTRAEITTRLDTHTGGFRTSVLNFNDTQGKLHSYFLISGKALPAKLPILRETITEILQATDFARPKKITQFLKDEIAGYESAFLSSGNALALTHLQGQLNLPGYLNDHLGGVRQFEQLKQWQKDAAVEAIISKLQELNVKILLSPHRYGNLSAEASDGLAGLREVEQFFEQFESQEVASTTLTLPDRAEDTAFVTTTKVNYNCLALQLGLEDKNHVPVILKYANLDYLWNKIRVIGGAYGTRANYSRATDTFTIMSYRDPRTSESYEDYLGLAQHLQQPLDDNALLQAITGAIGAFDSYELPHQKGRSAFLHHLTGRTYEELDQMRADILNTTQADFVEFGQKLVSLDIALKASVTNAEGAQNLGFEKRSV